MSSIKNLNKAKLFVQKKLRNQLIKKVDINQVTQEVKYLNLSDKKILTPEIKDMPFNYINLQDSTDFYCLPPIYTAILEDVIYYSTYDSLFTTSKKMILQSVISDGHFSKLEKFSLRKLYFQQTKKLVGNYSIFRTMTTYSNYYHSLIDQIPRIYLLNQPDYRNEEIKLLISKPLNQVEQFFLEKLLPSNIKVHLVNLEQLYHVERLIFPSIITRQEAGYLPKCYIDYLLSKVGLSRKRHKKNRIFISRSKAKKRNIINEKELVNLLENYGFKKYCLEDLPMEEQIELFYDAQIVIAPHGAGLTNLIFSEDINVLELFPNQKLKTHYYYLCKSVNHKYQYILNDKINIDKIQTGFQVDLLKVYKYLENLDVLRQFLII